MSSRSVENGDDMEVVFAECVLYGLHFQIVFVIYLHFIISVQTMHMTGISSLQLPTEVELNTCLKMWNRFDQEPRVGYQIYLASKLTKYKCVVNSG